MDELTSDDAARELATGLLAFKALVLCCKRLGIAVPLMPNGLAGLASAAILAAQRHGVQEVPTGALDVKWDGEDSTLPIGDAAMEVVGYLAREMGGI